MTDDIPETMTCVRVTGLANIVQLTSLKFYLGTNGSRDFRTLSSVQYFTLVCGNLCFHFDSSYFPALSATRYWVI